MVGDGDWLVSDGGWDHGLVFSIVMSGVICRITLLPIVLICFRGRLCFLVKRDEVRSPFAMDAVREFIADVSPPPVARQLMHVPVI